VVLRDPGPSGSASPLQRSVADDSQRPPGQPRGGWSSPDVPGVPGPRRAQPRGRRVFSGDGGSGGPPDRGGSSFETAAPERSDAPPAHPSKSDPKRAPSYAARNKSSGPVDREGRIGRPDQRRG